MASSDSSAVLAGFIKDIDEASVLPDDVQDVDEPSKVYIEHLNAICNVVKKANDSKDSSSLSSTDWIALLNKADDAISSLCSNAYEDDITDCMRPFGVGEVGSEGYIKTKKPFLGTGGTMQSLLKLIMNFGGQKRDLSSKEAIDGGFGAARWKDTTRPSPHSSPFSRFTQEFNQETIQAAIDSQPAAIREAASSVVFACAELFQYSIRNPTAMAIGGNTAVVSCAGGWKERNSCAWRFTFPGDRSEGSPNSGDAGLEEDTLHTGFASPFHHLVVDDPFGIWAADEDRIKVFDIAKGELMHTLNSGHIYRGPFVVYDDSVIRSGQAGKFAAWQKSDLKLHAPAMYGVKGSKRSAFGGAIDTGDVEFADNSDEVEISKGQSPTSTFSVANMKTSIELLCKVPNSSRLLFTCGATTSESDASYGIRAFDVAQPESGATIVGLGLGTSVSQLVAHEDVPEFFIAAGEDQLARIYDYKHPFPQMVLDGHSNGIMACTIAPFGGKIPIVFTGGKDELVRAWDIRHTKSALYELSAGTLVVQDLGWHDASQTLLIVGENKNEDRMGNHHDYTYIGDDEDGEEDVDDDGDSVMDPEDESSYDEPITHWPSKGFTGKDYFGKRWCATTHSVLEYRFSATADPKVTPVWDEPHLSGW